MFVPENKTKRNKTEGHEESQGGVDLSVDLVATMVSQVFAYIQSHRIINSKYVQFSLYQLHINKAV